MAMASTHKQSKDIGCGPKLVSPIMKQVIFSWSSTDKYSELRDFKKEVKDIQSYSISQAERVPIIRKIG